MHMKTSAPFFHFYLKTIVPVLILLSFSACKNDSDDPQDTTSTFVGTYTGKMVATGQLMDFELDPIDVEIQAGSKSNEVKIKFDFGLGEADFLPATVSGNTITLAKHTIKDDFGTMTSEGSGTLSGKLLTLNVKQTDDTGANSNIQITATKK